MYVSIVSHGHSNLIIELGVIKNINEKHTVILTDNLADNRLEKYCKENNIHYISNKMKKGFGENNNQNYFFAKNTLEMKKDDFFLVLNPDVEVGNDDLDKALEMTMDKNIGASTINLIKDNNLYDYNVRNFPKLINFIESYLFNKNRTIIDKSRLESNMFVDWASGSFLLIRSELYEKVGGFDENYFMYCEDLDICKRMNAQTGEGIYYIHEVKAKHLAAHNNRRLFSKHFLWHLRSIIRYCLISKY